MHNSSYNKVFVVGLQKTGTKSLNEALNILGIKSTHDISEIKNAINYAKKNNLNLLHALENYQGFTEPFIREHYQRLDKQYPNSKFILSYRDSESWLNSCKRHVNRNRVDVNYTGKWLYFSKYTLREQWKRWNEEIMDYFKDRPNDLLIMNLGAGDGWEKLCSFLNKPVPSIPFPKIKYDRDKEAPEFLKRQLIKDPKKMLYLLYRNCKIIWTSRFEKLIKILKGQKPDN